MVTNRWSNDGRISNLNRLLVKAYITSKATNSAATGEVGDYYEFFCKSKGLPSFEDVTTWTTMTDNPLEQTGVTYGGKIEKLKEIELELETAIEIIFGDLSAHQNAGDLFKLEWEYDDPSETSVYKIELANCFISGIDPAGGENNGASNTKVKFQPRGGLAADMPVVTSTARQSDGGL